MKQQTLLSYLKKYHYGADKAASSGVLEVAFSVAGREIRTVVNALHSGGEPLMQKANCDWLHENGYYYAANEQELRYSIRQLESRIGQIERSKKGLEKALPICSNKENEAAHGTCHI